MRHRLIVTDVDNTLYDWVSFYVPSFLAMVEKISEISGLNRDELFNSFRRTHQRHGTSEYSFAIEELDALDRVETGLPAERLEKYRAAIKAFSDTRSSSLKLYPDVLKTLKSIRDKQILIVAHSDTISFPVGRRLRQLGIDNLFDAICATRDPGVPEYLPIELARSSPEDEVAPRCEIIELPPGIRKPQAEALIPILRRFDVQPEEVLYVGDSLSRDLRMAQACGIQGIWARYGQNTDPVFLDVLRQITFWTDQEIAYESRLQSSDAAQLGTHSTIDCFAQVLDYF